MNVIDAIATLVWVSTGLAFEANPLMAHLIDIHPILFVAGKLTLVLLGSILLWRYRDRTYVIVTIVGLFGVYYAILLFHLSASSHLWGEILFSGAATSG